MAGGPAGAQPCPLPLTSRAWALLLALATVWAGSFFFVGIAVREWTPLSIVLARVGLGAAIFWLVAAVQGLPMRRDGAAWRAHLGMGLLNNAIPLSLIVWAQSMLPSGVASVFNATTPLFGVLVAHLAGAERATPARLLGVALGLTGVAMMAGADPAATPPWAAAAMLAATFSYALAGVWGRRGGRLAFRRCTPPRARSPQARSCWRRSPCCWRPRRCQAPPPSAPELALPRSPPRWATCSTSRCWRWQGR